MRFLASLLRILLSTRYRMTLKGVELFNQPGAKFILPNHQALVDPQILFSQLSSFTRVVPVVSEIYFNKPVLSSVFKALGAVPVSDISLDNRDHHTLHHIAHNVSHALAAGTNVLLYPSGQIAGQGYEKIFNKQSAWAVTCELPAGTRIIGVRITGLWGSMWSRAWMGKSPEFAWTALKALFYVLANIVFFVPKRQVTIEFCDLTQSALDAAKLGKQAFNELLENYYNANGEEEVLFLKHFFFAPKSRRQLPERIEESVADSLSSHRFNDEDVDAEVLNQIVAILEHETQMPRQAIHLNANLKLELSIDSLGLVSVISAIETQFGVKADAEITAVKTVADLYHIALNRHVGHEVLKPSLLAPVLNANGESELLHADADATIPELFLKSFRKEGNRSFAYDKMLGTSSRKDFLLKAHVVARILRHEVDGPYVGIMLPALQSTTLLVAATYLAGKTPVMLNWTVGPRVMEHCIADMNLRQVITAKSFFDKVADLLPDSVKVKCLFFEQKVRSASFTTKLKGLMDHGLHRCPGFKNNDVAVVLFTSGSEALPKAVHLTHRNLLADLHGCLSHLHIDHSYIFLAFLPPFHSFGFTVLTILPLVTGLQVAYTPDPTDSREVLKILTHTGANAILGTPTFLRMLLGVADNGDLSHVKLAVSGAESLPASVMDTFLSKCNANARLLEGYGITECSPVLAINPLDKQKAKSVGTFIKGIDALIVDYNTWQPLPVGCEGMIVVKGESVFKGYVDPALESPFVCIQGSDYYKTGDLGHLDDEGYLFITGRLKRFIKIGGEMISLPAIESVLLEKYGDPDSVMLAVEGSDAPPSPQIIVFSVRPLNLPEINETLRNAGFSAIVKIHDLVVIPEIPLLGTGKTDYKVLKGMVRQSS
ncbi:AMP-binding protein [Breznakibacter xylanolyticus]|nr:AMP-binding protein [Breznakibacter xylanolyticus]